MRVSLLIRRHRALVLAAAALAAGFLAAAPRPALVILACGVVLAVLVRLARERPGARRRQDAALGDFGCLEGESSPDGG